MKDRHRHQRNIVSRPFIPVRLFGLTAGLYQIEKIGMRQHRAFWPARGAGSIELDRDVLSADRNLRVFAALRVAPRRVVEPFRRAAFGRDDRREIRQLRFDVANLRDEFRPDEQHGRLAIPNDKGDFRSGQPPVHRRHHHIGFHCAEQELKIDVAVLAEIGDALARLDADRPERVGDAIGLDVELGKAGLAPLEFKRCGVTAAFGACAHHIGKVCRFL